MTRTSVMRLVHDPERSVADADLRSHRRGRHALECRRPAGHLAAHHQPPPDSIKLDSDRGSSETLRIEPRLVTDSLFALRNAALAGLGVTVLSQWVVTGDIEQGTLTHLLPHWRSQPLPLYVAYPQARFYPAKLRRFVELLKQAFAT